MSRQIKFRVWHTFYKRFENKGYLTSWCNEIDKNYVLSGVMENQTEEDYFEDDGMDVIFHQFTGHLDKNGKDIFEGDIINFNRGIGNWTGERMETTHEVVFSEEVFAFVLKYGSSYIKFRKHWNYEYEVIGNVFETPELLK